MHSLALGPFFFSFFFFFFFLLISDACIQIRTICRLNAQNIGVGGRGYNTKVDILHLVFRSFFILTPASITKKLPGGYV